jgi:hypothetical protein
MSADLPDNETRRYVWEGADRLLQTVPSDDEIDEIFDYLQEFSGGQEVKFLDQTFERWQMPPLIVTTRPKDAVIRQGKSRLSREYYNYLLGTSEKNNPPYGLTELDFESYSPIPPSVGDLIELAKERIPNETAYYAYGLFLWLKQQSEQQDRRKHLADEVTDYANEFTPYGMQLTREQLLNLIARVTFTKEQLTEYGMEDLIYVYYGPYLDGQPGKWGPPIGLTTDDYGTATESGMDGTDIAEELLKERVPDEHKYYLHGLLLWMQGKTNTGPFGNPPRSRMVKFAGKTDSSGPPPKKRPRTSDAQIRAALIKASGNVAEAVRLLQS